MYICRLKKLNNNKRMKNLIRVCVLFFALLVGENSWGQILTFDFAGLAGNEATAASNSNNANLNSSTISRGAGLTASTNGDRFNATNWALTSIANAVTGNNYMEFTITPNTGHQFSVSSIVINLQRSGTGPSAVALRSSADGYTTNLDGQKTIVDNTTTQSFTFTFSQSNSSVAVTYRFYMFAEAVGGSGGIGDGTGNDLVVNGTVTSISAGAEINVQGNNTTIVDGDAIPSTTDHTDYGNVVMGSGLMRTFTIQNTGSTALNVTNITLTGTHAFDFFFISTTAGTIPSGGTMDLIISFAPSALGLRTATVSIFSDDADEATYDFAIQGNGTNSLNSDIVAVASSEAATISSLNNAIVATSTDGVQVWQLTIRDGGATLNDTDSQPTIVTGFTLTQEVASGNSVGNWQTAINSIAVFDGATNLGGTITVNANNIQFSGLNISTTDNSSKTISIRLSLNTALNAGGVNDNEDFVFSLRSTNVTTNSSGSGMTSFSTFNSTNGQNMINIVATELRFVAQPSNTAVTATMTSPTVQATDVHGNRDVDFTSNISISSTGTLNTTPKIATPASGLATFTTIIHTVVGTGFVLSANAVGLTGVVSNTFDIINQTLFKAGDIIVLGVNANDNACSGGAGTDIITFVTFVDIPAGTKFIITDNGFEREASMAADTWGDSEGVWEVERTGATITAGTVFTFHFENNNLADANADNAGWSFSNVSGFSSAFNMNVNGDQMFITQGGTWSNPAGSNDATFTGGTILFAFNSNSSWKQLSNASNNTAGEGPSQNSLLPPQIRCYSFVPNAGASDFIKYGDSDTPSTLFDPASKFEWLNKVTTGANWQTYANCSAYNSNDPLPTSISINTAISESGRWVGNVDSNWFNCMNWGDRLVPTDTTDVFIETTTGSHPQISSTATFSDDFSDIAQVRNITIATATDRILSFPSTGTHILEIYGNWINQKGTANFTEGNGTLNFVGTTAQTITTTGGTETFHNIGFNNTLGISLNNTNVLVAGTATFTNGIVTANNANTARMEFLDNALAAGASNASFVNGWVCKVGDDAFTFPVGDEVYYASIGISAPSSTTDHFTATYDRVYPNPYNISLKDVALDHVGNCEHWILNRTGGASNVNVTLSYENTRSCGITAGQEASLRVARWDGAMWQNEGNSSMTATTITSESVTNFSPFTLASIVPANPLPVEMLSFKGHVNKQGNAELEWQTASEIRMQGFEVEKSTDGKNFSSIGFVGAKGQNLNQYSLIDNHFLQTAYYRLRIVNSDKTFKYSQTISLQVDKVQTQLLVYPNPATQNDIIKVVLGDRNGVESIKAQVYSQSGALVYSTEGSLEQTENNLTKLLSSQSKGMYIIYLQTNQNQIYTTKLIKQ